MGDKRYAKQNLKDELVLAAIIAGGMASGRKVRPSYSEAHGGRRGEAGHENSYGLGSYVDTAGPCCAVGAGVLFAALDVRNIDALAWFTRFHDVHMDFAAGVSDGFEDITGCTTDHVDYNSDDYLRGVAVGDAVYDFFCGGE